MTDIRIEAGTWVFPGRLTHVEVAAVPNNIWNQCPSSGDWILDLSAVQEIDSAFLALLLETLRQAKRHKLKLQIKGLGASTAALLKVYGIYSLFENNLT